MNWFYHEILYKFIDFNSNFSKYYIYNNNSYEITYCLIYESNREKNNNLNN